MALPMQCNRKKNMCNKIPIIKTKVLGIESHKGPPYNKGQSIGLMFKEGTIMHRGDLIRKPQESKE